jgi:hypothetical protein
MAVEMKFVRPRAKYIYIDHKRLRYSKTLRKKAILDSLCQQDAKK